MIGQAVGGYRVAARLGKGGMGAVYLAEDEGGRVVALKVLEGTLALSPEALRRFEQEIKVLRRLDHPRIVGALSGIESDGGSHWYAMEYVAGRNLAQVLAANGALEPAEALAVVSDALDGLAAAHERGIVHRDLKSANILLDPSGRAKLCDFGLARAVDLTRLTLSGQYLGTPAYTAPEQAEGVDGRPESDLYSLGVVLYEALTGSLPFTAPTPLALLRMHLDVQPVPPSERKLGLPADLDPLVLRALAKKPEDRYADARAFRAAVEEARAGLPAGSRLSTMIQSLAAQETVDLSPKPARRSLAKSIEVELEASISPRWGRRLFWGGLAAVALVMLVLMLSMPMLSGVDRGPRTTVLRVRILRKDGGQVEGQVLRRSLEGWRLRLADGGEVLVPLNEISEVVHQQP